MNAFPLKGQSWVFGKGNNLQVYNMIGATAPTDLVLVEFPLGKGDDFIFRWANFTGLKFKSTSHLINEAVKQFRANVIELPYAETEVDDSLYRSIADRCNIDWYKADIAIAEMYRYKGGWRVGDFDELGDEFREFKGGLNTFLNSDTLNPYTKAKLFLQLTDGIENLANAPKTFDRRLAELERAFDNMVRDEFSYSVEGLFTQSMRWTPGQLVPNTKEIFDYVDKYLIYGKFEVRGVSIGFNLKPGGEWFGEIKGGVVRDGVVLDTSHGDVSEEELATDPYKYYNLPIVSNQLVATSAMANSLEYRKWAIVAMEDLMRTANELTVILGDTISKGGVSGEDLGSAWYSILMINANNKYILHSIEEARLQQALLGTELHIRTTARFNELNSQLAAFEDLENP